MYAAYTQYFADHAAELHYYIQPRVVEEVPASLTSGQFVAQLEEGKEGVADVTRALGDEAHAFLASDDRLLLLLGEAGSGKSMFTWLTAQQQLTEFEAFERGLGAQGGVASECPWIPVVIDLKRYRTSELMGLLPRFLKVDCVHRGAYQARGGTL
jgi:hypothetical protein